MVNEENQELVIQPAAYLDDPVWAFVLEQRLQPYIDSVRHWWQNTEKLVYASPGTFDLPKAPPGMSYKVSRSAKQSIFKGVPAFPFLPTRYLQLSRVPGGAYKMIKHICALGFQVEEFTILEHTGLPSIDLQGQIVAFIPTDKLLERVSPGFYIYISREELSDLSVGIVPPKLLERAYKYT